MKFKNRLGIGLQGVMLTLLPKVLYSTLDTKFDSRVKIKVSESTPLLS